MKRFFCIAALVAVLSVFCDKAYAQHNYGVVGGFTFSELNGKNVNRGMMTQYHAGLTYKLSLPLGFAVQPSVLYQVRGAKTKDALRQSFDMSVGYVEIPVSLQWGPDLLLFRPFLDVTPFVGFAVNNKFSSSVSGIRKNVWDAMSRWEYGLGLGVGLEIWKFQVVGRYNWNFGKLFDGTAADMTGLGERNFGGVTLSVAFMF